MSFSAAYQCCTMVLYCCDWWHKLVIFQVLLTLTGSKLSDLKCVVMLSMECVRWLVLYLLLIGCNIMSRSKLMFASTHDVAVVNS